MSNDAFAFEAFTHIVAHPHEFCTGFIEGLGGMGITYDDDPNSPRSVAYDLGRSLRLGMGVTADDAPPAGIQRPIITFGDPDVLTAEQAAAHNKLWGGK